MTDRVTTETYFVPYALLLLASLAHRPLALVIDGSCVGKNCQALVINVVYKQRALPGGWLVVEERSKKCPVVKYK
jgi:hypothetical protein